MGEGLLRGRGWEWRDRCHAGLRGSTRAEGRCGGLRAKCTLLHRRLAAFCDSAEGRGLWERTRKVRAHVPLDCATNYDAFCRRGSCTPSPSPSSRRSFSIGKLGDCRVSLPSAMDDANRALEESANCIDTMRWSAEEVWLAPTLHERGHQPTCRQTIEAPAASGLIQLAETRDRENIRILVS